MRDAESTGAAGESRGPSLAPALPWSLTAASRSSGVDRVRRGAMRASSGLSARSERSIRTRTHLAAPDQCRMSHPLEERVDPGCGSPRLRHAVPIQHHSVVTHVVLMGQLSRWIVAGDLTEDRVQGFFDARRAWIYACKSSVPCHPARQPSRHTFCAGWPSRPFSGIGEVPELSGL